MVSSRTLFGLGLAVIAIVSLATIAVVEQMAIQRQSTGSPMTHVATSVPTSSGPYILVTYSGYTFTEFTNCKPNPGYIYLDLWISIQNLGYASVPTASLTFGNPNPYYFYLAVGSQQFSGFPISCQSANQILPMTNVVNGLTVSGYLAFEIPANFRSFTLIYQPPGGNYNVQYVNQGYTTGTVKTATT